MRGDDGYSLSDLSTLSDVPARTIRYYVAQGLLPAPGREGPSTRYSAGTLARLRLIRRLQREHLPLAEIRARFATLDDAAIERLTDEPPEPPPDSALDYVRSLLRPPAAAPRATAPPRSAPANLRKVAEPSIPRPMPLKPTPLEPLPPNPERSQWERIAIEPDIELHVRRPLSRTQNRRVERLIAFARQLLEEDKP
jgi:DNA-binding transcriptional MerR regulator